MTRDVTKEEQEAIRQIAHNEGYAKGREELMKEYGHGHAIIRAANHTYLLSEYAEREKGESYRRGLEEGREQGIAMEQSRIRPIEWSKLKRIILTRSIIGSVIGCGIILAVAVGLSNI